MNRVTKAAFAILFILAPLGMVAGQSSAQKQLPTDQIPAVETTKPIEPSLQKILSVLDHLIETQRSFSDNDLRIVIRAQVADMLWTYDEPRARGLFEDAFLAMLNAPVREQSIWVAPIGPDAHYPVRSAVIPAMVRRDPALAARLAEKIEDLPPNTDPKVIRSRYDQYYEHSQMRSQLAGHLALKDPLRAAQVGKPFAERGDIMRLNGLLRQIRMKEPKAAEELFLLALERAKLGQPSIDDIRWFGSYLFPYFEEGLILNLPEGERRDPYLPIATSPQVIPQFLELAYEVVSRRVAAVSTLEGANSNAYHPILKLLGPHFDRFLPDKAVSFRALVEEALRSVPPEERPNAAQDPSAMVQELLAKADKLVESRRKDVLYNRASVLATTGPNFDQAAAITEKITDEKIRATTRLNLRLSLYRHRSQEMARALGRNDFGKVEAIVGGTSDSELRLRLLGSMIERLVRIDRERAVQMLGEAERRTLGLEGGVQKARQLVVLAGIAARIDTDRGFETMKRAIAELNRAGFAPEWEKYRAAQSNSEADKDPMFTNIGLGPLLNDRDFEWLGSRDLNRALAVAQEIQMKEASALAQLAICRGALNKLQTPAPPKPVSTSKHP